MHPPWPSASSRRSPYPSGSLTSLSSNFISGVKAETIRREKFSDFANADVCEAAAVLLRYKIRPVDIIRRADRGARHCLVQDLRGGGGGANAFHFREFALSPSFSTTLFPFKPA